MSLSAKYFLSVIFKLSAVSTYIVTFALFVGVFGHFQNPAVGFFDPQYITAHLCGGGLMLGAWFMATDYVTSPSTAWGKVIFGVGCGLITFLIRFAGAPVEVNGAITVYGSYAEGVAFAILLMNILTPYIDKLTAHKVFGGKKA